MLLKEILISLSNSNAFVGFLRLMFWRVRDYPIKLRTEKGIKLRMNFVGQKKYDKIKNFKDKYAGKRCFIVATGPSLTIRDLELLSNEITFGMNSISKIYDETTWRPTYFGIQDKYVYAKMESSILANYKNSKNVFVADVLSENFSIPENFIQFPYYEKYHIYDDGYNKYSAKFSDDAYKIVYDGFTITYSLIEIAVYMGFKEIYLLGVDCNYLKGEKNHFVESGFVDKNAESNPIRMRVGYKAAKKYADAHNIKIINCTRGGMLEVFPRMKLEDVLRNS